MSEVAERRLRDVVQQVFSDLLALDVEDLEQGDPAPHQTPWLARVGLDGGWTGYVDLVGEERFLTETAGILLGVDPRRLSPADRDDAWGELGNLVAGHLLHDLPPNVRLSRPTVAPLPVPFEPGEPIRAGWFRVEGFPLAVCLYAGPARPVPDPLEQRP